MLLRRFQQHVSSQNWTAVVLDFFVVVLGLFMGLQIDGWNENRKDAIREREYLEQLQTDFNRNIDILTMMAERHEEMAGDLMFAIGAVKSEALAPEDEERFKWAVMTMQQVPPMSLNMAGYRALVAAGDFSLLSDSDLRSLLVSIEAEIEFDQNAYWRNLGDSLGFSDEEMFDISRTVPHPSGKGIAIEVDFGAILDTRGALGVLANARRTHSQIAQNRRQLRELFVEANSVIGESLSR
ncbi:hypothetical protein EY643_18885 [Halioglobus maricola]|uniref:Uncharacterized protein n=1 Tax=Halioglobus maricola TaxID=2601894 RepID=A0A5P9NP31_9GAMM|nr:hypothetical protein [Halioglobus maricola]QFU77571.1 hypothetical protein EY643_18885 [Halioglobus maricola]